MKLGNRLLFGAVESTLARPAQRGQQQQKTPRPLARHRSAAKLAQREQCRARGQLQFSTSGDGAPAFQLLHVPVLAKSFPQSYIRGRSQRGLTAAGAQERRAQHLAGQQTIGAASCKREA